MVEVKNIETHFPKNLKEDDFENRDDFLQNISVTFDIKGNGVFMPEFQRYEKRSNCGLIMSQSTMHSMEKFMSSDYDPFTKYVDNVTKEHIKVLYNQWNAAKENLANFSKENPDETKTIENLRFDVYEAFERLVHNLPRGLELWATAASNYLQLKTIVIQRSKHKNQEDWGAFIDFCFKLPRFRELCGFESSDWDLEKTFPFYKSVSYN